MHDLLQTVKVTIKNIFIPSFCACCSSWISTPSILCDTCYNRIQPIVSTRLMVTPTVTIPVFALSPYQDPLKTLILAKTQSQRLASVHLGRLLWDMMPLVVQNFDYIVPIPLHWTRYAYRGYNQAEVIGSVIAQKSKKPMLHLLKRTRRTLLQSTLTVEQRAQNLADAFEVRSSCAQHYSMKDKHILLIDDLMTTGATLKAAAKRLLSLKPAYISVAVICRTL